MCGRYVATATTDELLEEFAVDQAFGDDLPPSWNVAPTQPIRIVAERGGDDRGGDKPAGDGEPVRQLRTVRWGLVPHWAKDPGMAGRMINARSETVASKPSFRAAAARRRCLVPADGYYEWMPTPPGEAPGGRGRRGKTPYFLHDPDGQRLAMAGLYEIWRDPAVPDDDPGRLLWTATVITRAAPDSLGHIHDRSPVVVPPDMWDAWLDCSTGRADTADDLLAAIPPPHLVPRRVGTAVGNVRHNGPGLIEEV